MNCMTTKEPKAVIDDLQSAFNKEQVQYRLVSTNLYIAKIIIQLNGVSFKGSKSGVRFEA